MGSARASQLEILLQSGVSGNDPRIRTAVLRLSNELKSRLDRGSADSHDFFATAVASIARIKGSANAEVRFDCLYNSAQYFYVAGFGSAALETAQHVKAVASLSRNRALERKAMALAGIVYNELGDLSEAVAHHATALSIARETGDTFSELCALSNLGVALMDAGLYQEALPCFQRVANSPLPELAQTDLLSSALANTAKAYFHLGQPSFGLSLIQRSIDTQAEPTDAPGAIKRAFREFVYVQIALELGKLSLARKRAKECVRFGRFGETRRGIALADLATGLCEVYGGSVERGLRMLEAVARRRTLETSLVVEAAPALVKAYDAAGRIDEALKCLQELIGHIQTTRERGIKALVDAHRGFALAELSEMHGDLQPLKLMEADLRAKVAQREAASWQVEMFERMAATADLRDEDSGEHSYRVGRLAGLVGATLGWGADRTGAIELAARLHDIGKVAMPDRILLSTHELQEAERHFVATHTTIGAELLAGSSAPNVRMAEEIARHHHEWWNGEGYPSKLKGKRIPIHARIVALADVFDALTHGRPFSPPWPIDKAIEEIRARKGTQFDPELTDVFLGLIERLRNEHQDLDEYLGRAGRNSPFLVARNKIRAMLAEERDHEKKATVEGNATHH